MNKVEKDSQLLSQYSTLPYQQLSTLETFQFGSLLRSIFSSGWMQVAKGLKAVRATYMNLSRCVLNQANRINQFVHNLNFFGLWDKQYIRIHGEEFLRKLPEILAISKKEKLTDDEIIAVRNFFTTYNFLPTHYFDRYTLLGGKEELQRILSPKLDLLLRDQQLDPQLMDDKEHQLKIAIARAKLATKMGVGAKRAGGCNGAVIVKNLEGHSVGVFKQSENRHWNLSRSFKNFFGQARLLDNSGKKEQIAEEAMHLYSKTFGFDLAPAAMMTKLNKQKGAFLAFLGGYQELASVRQDFEKREKYTKEEKIKWQKAMVAIFTTLNYDPHDENLFVKIDEQGKLTDLKIIDAGNAIRVKRLPGKGSKGHRQKPGLLKISAEKFEPEVIEFIRETMTDERLDSFIQQISERHPKFWTQEMDKLHRRTLRVLREGVLSGQIETPRELLNILTEAHYEAILNGN